MTDNLSTRQGKKLKNFLDELLNKYPPMTFQEYRNADGNHTNWFPARYYQTTASMYREWFTCAVLNNHDFIVRVYRQRDRDAVKIFTDIINSVDFHRYIIKLGNEYTDYWFLVIMRCITFPLNFDDFYSDDESDDDDDNVVKINYNWDANIAPLIDYYNAKFQLNNINEFSKYITIPNTISDLVTVSSRRRLHENVIPPPYPIKKKFIIGGLYLRILPGRAKPFPITVDDIDGIYDIQVGRTASSSNSAGKLEIIFYANNTLPENDNNAENSTTMMKSTAMISTLSDMIVDALK